MYSWTRAILESQISATIRDSKPLVVPENCKRRHAGDWNHRQATAGPLWSFSVLPSSSEISRATKGDVMARSSAL